MSLVLLRVKTLTIHPANDKVQRDTRTPVMVDFAPALPDGLAETPLGF